MKKIIEDLYKYNACLLGEGYDQRLDYINKIIPLEIHKFKSGTKAYDWTIPDEWIIKDAWVKFNGVKILDYKENPLCVSVGSIPVHEKIDKATFKKHLRWSTEQTTAYTYDYIYYESDWGFTMPRDKVEVRLSVEDEEPKFSDVLEEGEYEVFIDSEYKPGVMKIGVHTIPGKTDKEILLFAHLDHPYQANNNLSSVAGLITMVDKIKKMGYEHTVKLVFCPGTIGSIVYASKIDISKVAFVISLDCIGNDNTVLFQQTFNKKDRLNKCALLALQGKGTSYRAGNFRFLIGSDEYVFNDPAINIPAILFSRYEYAEYHTSDDTPDKIVEDSIIKIQEVVLSTIDIYEKDFIPERKVIGPLMRSKHNVQTPHKLMNLNLDYFWYDIDGKKYLSEIIHPMGLSFDFAYDIIKNIKKTLK